MSKMSDTSTAALEASEPLNDLRAIVIGGTGAIGRSLVQQLLADERYSEVTTIGRRKVPRVQGAEDSAGDAALTSTKLKQVVVDMDEIGSSDAWQNKDVAFCALGTTRSAAGSAQAFVKVDRDYVEAAGAAAKAAGVKHFSLVTAQGAKDVWVPHTVLHPLLYARTKWEAQEAIIRQGFERVSIFQPGLLNREGAEDKRPWEGIAVKLMPSIHVATVAAGMMNDAATSGSAEPAYFSNSGITQRAQL